MNREVPEKEREIKKLGNIEVEKSADGRIGRINHVQLQSGDRLVILQRHQKPASFSKEQLLATASKVNPENLDFSYDPETTPAGGEMETERLAHIQEVFGDMNLIAATPRKRGAEHKFLVENQFPGAKKNASIDELLDDSSIGLLGESLYGAFEYQPDETARFLKHGLRKDAKFGRGANQAQRTPFSYMEAWVKMGYAPPENKWKVESPEDFSVKTLKLIGKIDQEKNYFITHEANCVIFHMLAERKPNEIAALFEEVGLPIETKQDLSQEAIKAKNFLELFSLIKRFLLEHPISGYHYTNVLTSILEKVKLKSGVKGYGSVSVYVIRENAEKKRALLEAAYDEQF